MMRAAAVLGVALMCTGAAYAGAQGNLPPAVPPVTADPQSDVPRWFDTIVGKKLVSVDGSTITIAPSEGGLMLEIVSANGNPRDLTFTFLGDSIGAISDGGPKAAGVFRQTDSGIQAEFADGHTETFALNQSGGISMILSASASNSYCMRWYPDGHMFDAADRKAALAAYASKLGLAEPAVQKTASGSSCSDPVSLSGKTHRAKLQKGDSLAGNAMLENASPAQPILVRTSEVHLIDADPVAAPVAQAPIVQATPLGVQPAQPTPQLQATLPPRPAQLVASAAPDKPVLQSRGASACLSVDSDGSNWGFRNTCAYAVQYAYCLKNGYDKSTACGTGAGSGNIVANGFASVLSSSAIVTADQEFRWIACVGAAGQVAAHLDRPDPPAGRCVVQSSS